MPPPATVLADRVVKPAPDIGFDLFIFSMYEKPRFQARTPATASARRTRERRSTTGRRFTK